VLTNTYTLYRGTLHSPHLELNVDRAKMVKDSIMTSANRVRPKDSTDEQWIVSILKKSGYSVDNMTSSVTQKSDGGKL
jgi:hypothetical protein